MVELTTAAGSACLERILTKPMSVDAGHAGKRLSFQHVVIPLIGVLTREAICQSMMTDIPSCLHSTVYAHRKVFLEDGVLHCIDQLLARGSLQDNSPEGRRMAQDQLVWQPSSLQHALLAIVRLIYQLIKRIKDASHELENAIKRLCEQGKACLLAVDMGSAENRFLTDILAREMNRLQAIVSDASAAIMQPEAVINSQGLQPKKGRGLNMLQLKREYDPPGILSLDGPRHDNDNSEISLISIVPTQEELTCTRAPFLPSNCIPDAPHFLPPCWKQQLDIHFRLYREDFLNPLRNGLMAFLDVLARTAEGQEDDLLKIKTFKGRHDNVNVNVYGGVRFLEVDHGINTGLFAIISFHQPSQIKKKSKAKRKEFWEGSLKRLMTGSLVFFVSCTNSNIVGPSSPRPAAQVVLGTVIDRKIDALIDDEHNAIIQISLTDPRMYIAMLNANQSNRNHEKWFLVDPSSGLFESYRSVLCALQRQVPATMPFGKYLAPTKEETDVMLTVGCVDPPMYTRVPNFRFDLSSLLGGERYELDVNNQESVAKAARVLQESKALDVTHPPGTGKTRIGVELMQVLVHNMQAMDNGPILCICYTNHALDQFLEHLLDKNITNIIRIGSRSKSERLDGHNLEIRAREVSKPYYIREAIRRSKERQAIVTEKFKKLQEALQRNTLSWEYVELWLRVNSPDQWEQFSEPPFPSLSSSDTDNSNAFTEVWHGKQQSGSVFYRWTKGADIEEMKRWNEEIVKARESAWFRYSMNPFDVLGDEDNESDELEEDLEPYMYEIPSTDRPLELLGGNVWDMSMSERNRLAASWWPKIRRLMGNKMIQLSEEAERVTKTRNAIFDENRRAVLRGASVIGMTTSGAAKNQALIRAVAPKIIVCEEAGEVVESHILSALSHSTQHLILIGDHLQLRPQIQTYNLSSDSVAGRHYNLDISLFERLVTAKTNPLPMSRLTIQRRMRPEISSLIRNTLYPDLEDGDNVKYPHVSGMGADLYFMDHAHPEDSKDQYGVQSFANTFEVKMIEALAHYLIVNGYNRPGDIAVLTPYLGQLSKLRKCLSSSFMLVMNEQDQEQLDMQDAMNESENAIIGNEGQSSVMEKISLQSQLNLQTIDNYQGEEAKIVIISLVRSDVHDDGTASSFASIGFLKSTNRTNVLLSRAKHGMYLIGNVNLMERAKHGIWPQVVSELRESDRVGEGFPIVCKNHPEVVNVVNTPEMFQKVSPNGGCDRPCGHKVVKKLPKCDHVYVTECHKATASNEPCGDCMEIVEPIVLPCDHVYDRPRCHQAKDPSVIQCKVKVTLQLPTCEHVYVTECNKSATLIPCSALTKDAARCHVDCPATVNHAASGAKRSSAAIIGVLPYALDVDSDPLLVLSCGHALAMTALDRELMKSSSLAGLHPENKGQTDVLDHGVESPCCPRCQRSVLDLMRYEFRDKRTRIDRKMKDEQIALSMRMDKAQKHFDELQGTLETTQREFLDFLMKTEAPPCRNPPGIKTRPLGKFVQRSSSFPQTNVESISKIYGIPQAHERAWKSLVKPLVSSIEQFTSVYNEVSQTTTKKIFDAVVASLSRSQTEADASSSSRTLPPSEDASAMEAVQSKAKAKAVKCGLPRNGHIDSTFIDSLQERTNTLLIILSLAFSAMYSAGTMTGWYWFIEDLITCVLVHVMMLRDVALDGNYKRRVIQARLMHLDLIYKMTKLIGLRPVPAGESAKGARLQRVKQLKKHQEMEQRQIKNSCLESSMAHYLDLATQLDTMMSRVVNIAKGEISPESEGWMNEDTPLFRPVRKETRRLKDWFQCRNGHNFVVEKPVDSLMVCRSEGCQASIGWYEVTETARMPPTRFIT
ncbi:hypothetical protein BGZ65_001414 [Modicella reniformis]|uniref:NFX1-type zinc finger-containing protein 1 n=1 Tax=Modicella reniformis TaxID=1440133 RepID=A0A9P6MJL2_9FUNG|nr:hypothetical protein BGZ65_001414 [Modicella reniformis]